MGAKTTSFSPTAITKLRGYDWPGNVRELENTVMRAALLAPGNAIRPEDIELEHSGSGQRRAPMNDGAALGDLITERMSEWFDDPSGDEPRDLYQRMVSELERPLIELALKRASGNQVKAARMLGLNRNTLRKKITDHKIALTRYPGQA